MGIISYGKRIIEDTFERLEDRKLMRNFVKKEDFENTDLEKRIRKEIIERDLSMPWCETAALLRRDFFGKIQWKFVDGEMDRLSQFLYEIAEEGDYTNARLVRGEVSRGIKARGERYKNCGCILGKELNMRIVKCLDSIKDLDVKSQEFIVRARKVWKALSRCTFYGFDEENVTLHTHPTGSPPSDVDKTNIFYLHQSLVISYKDPDDFYVYSLTKEGEEILWP